jgi:hypothetical protein
MSEHLHYIPIPEVPPSKVQKFLGKTLSLRLRRGENGSAPRPKEEDRHQNKDFLQILKHRIREHFFEKVEELDGKGAVLPSSLLAACHAGTMTMYEPNPSEEMITSVMCDIHPGFEP